MTNLNAPEEFLLEICIPTFMRPEILISNVRTILECNDRRFKISISTNSVEPKIFDAFSNNPRLKLHSFEMNQGFTKNVKWLLANSSGKFVMLLSDEDFIIPVQLFRILNYLESIGDSRHIIYVPTQDKFSVGNLAEISGCSLSFNTVMFLCPMGPTYMSGYIFQRENFSEPIIDLSFTDEFGNAYPFILLRNLILQDGGKFKIARGFEISKGEEAKVGGAMHTNRLIADSNQIVSSSLFNSNLNHVGPFVTSKEETSERFNFFFSHLQMLHTRRGLIYWLSVIQTGNRMKSGTGESIELKLRPSNINSASGSRVIGFEYQKRTTSFDNFFVGVISIIGFIVQKSAGVYRRLLNFRHRGVVDNVSQI
jgi:glycosyltransferase involved in cell wall biosynthesis